MCEIHNLKHSLNTGYIETQSKEQNNSSIGFSQKSSQKLSKIKNYFSFLQILNIVVSIHRGCKHAFVQKKRTEGFVNSYAFYNIRGISFTQN